MLVCLLCLHLTFIKVEFKDTSFYPDVHLRCTEGNRVKNKIEIKTLETMFGNAWQAKPHKVLE